ncbi:MAG: 50S ribosomal protein L22 [Bacteroidales bacterium OttesenSCG-928-I14]|jgi:large subunit ribosomal protein L22|nr:50S ribosomal protein L22 [Bacteroidales bacterium OttesenSCG-928-I14]
MGIRKRISAEKIKENRKICYFGKLNNVSVPARKARLVVDMIRGMEVFKALSVLKFSGKKQISLKIEKLLRSVISNWEQKTGSQAGDEKLFVTTIAVNSSSSLKRMRPAPRGRANRICKRFSSIVLYIGTKKM